MLTDPPEAEVVVKDSRGTIRAKGRSKGGEFREELTRGAYKMEVTAVGYAPYRPQTAVEIRPPGYTVERAYLKPTVGTIVVGPVQADATLLLDGKKPEISGIKKVIKKEDNQIVLEDVPEGLHVLRIEQPNMAPEVKNKVEVRGGSFTMITPMFLEAVVELEVISEPGARVYIDNEPMGATNTEGRLKRSDVKVGRHEIQLVKEGYEDYKDSRQFELGKRVIIDRRLTPKATSAEFSEDFGVGLRKWTVPSSGWDRKSGRVEISNAPQLGFVSGYNYRNFTMQFHLKLENSGGAAWAVRVKDASNYYLFYLSGPGGKPPKRFNTYIVRDNKFDLQDPVISSPVLQDLSPGSQYTIEINVSGNKIGHKITPTATGATEPLGYFEDPNNLFTIGSVGFRTVASEVFSIDEIIVQPIKP